MGSGDIPPFFRQVRVLDMKVRLAGILTRLLSLLHQIFVRFILFFFVLVAENGGFYAVPRVEPCGWVLRGMGVDALMADLFEFDFGRDS
jgi:hypothetical protein